MPKNYAAIEKEFDKRFGEDYFHCCGSRRYCTSEGDIDTTEIKQFLKSSIQTALEAARLERQDDGTNKTIMNTYKVTYRLVYPDCDLDKLDDAYVLANDFEEAERKVEKYYKEDCETAYVQKIEKLDADIIV